MDTTAQLIRAQTAMLEKLMDMVTQKDDAIVEMVRSVCAMAERPTRPTGSKSQSTVTAPEPASPPPTEEVSASQSQSKVTEPAEEVSVTKSQSKVDEPTESRSTDATKSQSKSSVVNEATKAPLRSNPKRGQKRPKADAAILPKPRADTVTPPVKRARKTTHMGMQQFKAMNMKRKMALVKRLWDGLSKDDQELVAYLCYGGMDTHVGCVWARVAQQQRFSAIDKYVVIDLKEARRWAEYRIHTGHCAPLCLTRQHSRDLVDYVQDGVFAAVKPVLVDAKDTLKQKGKCIVLPLDLYVYLLAAAEGIASFGRYALQSTTLRPPPTDEEKEEWEEEEELVRSWLMNQWQKRCVNLVACFGHSSWRAYQKWRIPRTGYDQPPQAAGSTSSAAASSASEDNLFSDSESFSCEEDNDIWRLIRDNYGEKV